MVVSTGRAHFDVMSIFEPLGIKTWVISANGAVIHDPDGRLYHHETIDKKFLINRFVMIKPAVGIVNDGAVCTDDPCFDPQRFKD